jgi:GT2 family glycosyltransferase
MIPTPKIAALLATYIGAAWIGEPFGTVIKQKYKTVSLIVSINSSVNNIKKIWFECSSQNIKNIIFPVNYKYGV